MQATALPHWDMTAIFPGLDSPEFEAGFQAGVAALDALTAAFDAHGIMLRETPLPITPETVALFETVLQQYNALGDQLHTLDAYLTAFTTTDSRDALAQAHTSRLEQQQLRFAMLSTRLTAWLGGLDIAALIAASPVAQAHAYPLQKVAVQARHLMSPAEEALAAQLRLTGSNAWYKLYENFSSQIMIELERQGEAQTLPMTAVRNLAYDAERATRKAAYEAELAAWKRNAVPITAALNSLKGEMLTLAEKRGWESPLEMACFNNNIDRDTLDAMLDTARDAFPDLRRYLHAKARALNVPILAWYDLFAPLHADARPWDFAEAQTFILEQFGAYSDKLAGLARRAFDERWIDAEPRAGKRGGAFCMRVRDDESRVLSNFQPAYAGMSTLAHELGHAYHNLLRAPYTFMQRRTPMTLAETASTFCETVVREAALARANRREQLAILEASLQHSIQVIVDITSRFLFEQALFTRRQERELSTEELCALMVEAQQATYGDGLDPAALHPYMWAVKPHYYSATFYNFPYMFGHLFSLGLYARYREAPKTFRDAYDALLAATGMADAASLAARFGIDIRTPAFWRGSLELIRADIDRFEALIAERE